MTKKLLNPTPVGRAGSVFLLAQAGDLAGGDLNGPAQLHDLRLDLVSEIKPLQVWFKWGVYEPTDQAEYVQALAVEKRYDPDQPRYPEGDPRGGQWRPEGGAAEAGSEAAQEVAKPKSNVKIILDFAGANLTPEEAQRELARRPESHLALMGLTAEDVETMFGLEGFDVQVQVVESGEYGTIFKVEFSKDGRFAGEQVVSFNVSDEYAPGDWGTDGSRDDLYPPWPEPGTDLVDYLSQTAPDDDEEPWPANEYIDVHADLMEFEWRFQDQGLTEELVNRQFAVAVEKRFGRVFTLADITIGKYTWANKGFQYQDESDAYRATDKFRTWCLERDIDLEAMGNDWPDFYEVADVANFKVAGVKIDADNISNSAVKPGVYDLGKAFMLDDDGHGDWDAVRDLSGLWDMSSTPSRGMSYYDQMLALGQLPLEFPDPAAALDASGISWAADVRRFHASRGNP
jgi:hypothetical protein